MDIQGYHLPDDLYYDENHFWIRDEGETLLMGLDDFGQQMAGDIVYIQLPADGKKLKAGKSFAKLESGKWLGKVLAPVNGTLDEANEELEINPGLINEDCYHEGWMYRIRPDNKEDLTTLVHGADKIKAWLLEEIEKYKDA